MRCNTTRESLIAKGAIKVSDKKSDAVAYIYENQGRLFAAVFFGKQVGPVAHYRYRSEAERAKSIAHYFEVRQKALAYTLERRAARKAWVNDYKVGEIVNTCWGYEQTNSEFYEVVGVKGKHVTLRRVAVTSYSTGWASEKVAPLAGEFIGEPFTRLAQERGIKIGSGSYTFATRTRFEVVAGVKVYGAGHTSSYA